MYWSQHPHMSFKHNKKMTTSTNIQVKLDPQGVDSSYHIWTNMSVRRGIIWGISAHSIDKGEVLIFSSLYIQKCYHLFLK